MEHHREPDGAANFCKYFLGGGSTVPDFPRVGTTKNFLLIGDNAYNTSGTFLGSDLTWIGKPPAGSTCPAASSLLFGTVTGLHDSDGIQTFSPVPAIQTDPSSTGWIAGEPTTVFGSSGTGIKLDLFKVTKNPDGTANVQNPGKTVNVPSYTLPASAPQGGATQTLDTGDTRLSQVISAFDPNRGTVGLWTSQTIFGGAGAQVRWYEIDPAMRSILQDAAINSPSLVYAFNAAISPDRLVNGKTKLFGSDMVTVFNTSSSTTFPSIKAVSKIGAGAVSGSRNIITSPGPYTDFGCTTASSTCRWGDYDAATPDPGAPTTATTGQVWATSEYNGTASSTAANWQTRNLALTP